MVRLRNRYLVVRITFQDERMKASKLSNSSLLSALQKSIRDLHGIYGVGVSRAGLHASYLNVDTNIAFIRMRRSAYDIVNSSMALVRGIDGEACTLHTLYTGATIRHCNLFLVKYQKKEIEKRFTSLQTDVQRKQFQLQLERTTFIQIPLLPK